MRLGLWNRLAVVATALALLIAPVVIIIDIGNDQAELAASFYKTCSEAAQDRFQKSQPPNYVELSTDLGNCRELSNDMGPSTDLWSWHRWGGFLQGTAATCLAIYLLIWGVVATARWVWRGKSAANPVM